MLYKPHHIALSVRDIAASQDFYVKLGFKPVHKWKAEDASLTIVHLKNDSIVLELFAYAKNRDLPLFELEIANNLTQVGVKHVGLEVQDLQACFQDMQSAGYIMGSTDVIKGRTNVNYFFIKDPDGMWVEIVQDNRGY